MVRTKNGTAKVYTTYHLRPGQTLGNGNTKPSERSLALVVPRSVYEGFHEKAHEAERLALLAEREAKRLAALKEATHDMSKSWEDTAQNIQRRRREELLSRRKVEEAERLRFTREMAKNNAAERAQVVKQAKELLLQRKPQCRLMNRALLASECFRERNEQLQALESARRVEKEIQAEEARLVREDVQLFRRQEEKRREERASKLELYKRELGKQIKANERNLKESKEATRKMELEDARNMRREGEAIQEEELRQLIEGKERLNKMFLEAIEQKRARELKVQQDEEFRDKSLQTYRDCKLRMEKAAKERARAAKENKVRRTEMLGKKLARVAEGERRAAERGDKEEEEEQDGVDREAGEREKERRARLEVQQRDMQRHEEESRARRREELDLKLWETLQRYKRDEFDREWDSRRLAEAKSSRMRYGRILEKQMKDDAARREQAALEADDSAVIRKMIQDENEKILAHGERLLQDSRGLRPVYPIAKAVEEFKREVGCPVPPFQREDHCEVGGAPKKKQGRRTICQPRDEKNVFFFA